MSKKYPKQKDEITWNKNPEQNREAIAKNPEQNREAIAPYNFVELPDRVVHAQDANEQERVQKEDGTTDIPPSLVRHDSFFSNRHTGTLSCTLVADSPIYIRTGLSPDDFAAIASTPFNKMNPEQRKTYAQFFALHGEPTLPGSSLRGMFRTLVEIAAHGKVSRVTDRQLVYRAVGDRTSLGNIYRESFLSEEESKEKKHHFRPTVHAGFMVKTAYGWQIKPAKTYGTGEEAYSYSRIEFKNPDREPSDLKKWDANIANAWNIWVSVDRPSWHKHAVSTGKPIHIWYAAVNTAMASKPKKPSPKLHKGVLVKTGRMNNKHMHFVFNMPVEDEKLFINVPRELELEYQEQFTEGQKGVLGSNKGIFQENQPVFFLLQDDNLVFLGHAQNFRIPYSHSPRDFVPRDVRDPSTTDLAEAMFGYVPTDDGERKDTRHAYAGRVFVDDAPLLSGENLAPNEPDTPDKSYITPRILASPKPTTFQHYLVQENEEREQLKHYASTPETDTVIRGHKLYWHQEQARKDTLEHDGQPQSWLHRIREDPSKKTDQSSQHTGMAPLAPGATFKVTLRFENLSDGELGALLWIVQLASDEGYRLKLGMGKPLGMGSVRFTDATVIRSDRKQRYSTLFDAQDTSTWETGEAKMTEDDQKRCIEAFQEYVLDKSCIQAPSFDKLPRIQLLKLLLSWPGPAHDGRYEYPDGRPMPHQELTRYMEIERPYNEGYVSDTPKKGKPQQKDKINEYANRPVLPAPWQVLGKEAPERFPIVDPPEREPQQPEEQRSVIDTRKPGTVVTVATEQGPGEIVDEEEKPYLYTLDDVIGNNLVVDQQVRFHPGKRKIPVGQGKKKKEKYVPWAVNIEPFVE